MATFDIVRQLTSANNELVVELINVRNYYEDLTKDFPKEYWLDCNFVLEALDLSSNITETNLARAPFPAVDITDTQADKAAKVADTWRAYPRIGLQLWLDPGINRWIAKGQPIVIQNTPVQFPVPIVSPYLNATSRVFLMGKNARLGISVVTGEDWQPIKGSDFITISGALRVDVQPKEKLAVPIKYWSSISKSLPGDEISLVLPTRPNRRYISLTNAGTTNLFCGFGKDIGLSKGNFLTPMGSLTLDSSRYYTEAEFWAYSVNGEGLLTGQEGLI